MKKHKCSRSRHLVLCLVVLALCRVPLAAGGQMPELKIIVDERHAPIPFKPLMLGANNEMLGDRARYDAPEFIDFYIKAGKPLIRFPAGTGSNYFDWETGRRILPPNPPADVKKRHSGGFNPGLTDEFISFVNTTQARFIVALNILAMEPERNARLMQKFKNAGVEVTHVEMGNELYFGGYGWAVRDIYHYRELAQAHAKSVRSIFPNVKIGVVIPSHIYSHEMYLETGKGKGVNRIKDWFSVTEEECKKPSTYFDAVIIHLYANLGMDGSTKKSNFLPYLKSYRNCQAHTDALLRPVMKQIESRFPGKELWVTEWHVGGFSGDLRSYRLRYAYLGALYAANFQMKILLQPKATVSNWHAFIQWGKFENESKEKTRNRGVTPLNNFHFYQLIAASLKGTKQLRSVAIANNKGYTGSKEYPGAFSDVEGLLIESTEGRRLILINRFEHPYQIGGITIDSKYFSISGGHTLSPDANMDLEKALGNEVRLDKTSFGATDACKLPPFSMTVLDIQRNRSIDKKSEF